MRSVIKIGTSTLAHEGGRLNIRRTERLCKVISDLKNSGEEIIVVSSGAIAMGVGKLGLLQRPSDMASKQATAAVGQCELMYVYDKIFSEYNHTVAQLLVTASDMHSEERHQNFTVTLNRLLEMGVIPIVNENDTIATEEITVGDNDTLASIVAVSANAQLMILLTDIDGLYTADPHTHPDARLIPYVDCIDEAMMARAGGSGSTLGTGGMRTKLTAAKTCLDHGCSVVIANGDHPDNLYDIYAGASIGTFFDAHNEAEA